MKRIKVYLFSVLICCSVFSVCADTNTIDYTLQLTQIQQTLHSFVSLFEGFQGSLDSIDDVLYDDIMVDLSDTSVNISHIKDSIDSINRLCQVFTPLLQSSVSDLDTIVNQLYSVITPVQNIEGCTVYIENYVSYISDLVSSIEEQMHDLSNVATELAQIQDQVASLTENGELNKEETQRAILTVMTQMTDTADSIKEALDILQQEGSLSQVSDAIAALKNEVTQIYRLLDRWDVNFFRYLYDRTFPNPSFEFYHISGSPFFENGYLTYSQLIGPLSSFNFVDWLASALIAHTEGLQVINDNILFIAKVLGTNSQEQAMSEFQQEADDTVSTIQSQYTELISSSSYTPKQFDISKTHLSDVRSFLGGLSGQNSYESYKVHNLDFSSFEKFGLPTAIAYQYDISTSSTFWEVCRAFFTCVWILLFASVFFMFVRTFYHFYHVCFNALAGNRSQGYEVSSIPLHW